MVLTKYKNKAKYITQYKKIDGGNILKKISFLVCMLIFAVNSFAISIIEGNKYIIEKKEIVISFKECKNNMINIKAYKKNTKIKESSFYINLDESQSQVLKDQDKYKVGRYLIREEKNGYSLWNGDVKLYESSFELVNSGIKEYKDSSDIIFPLKIQISYQDYIYEN